MRKEDKEEDEEIEGAVTPRRGERDELLIIHPYRPVFHSDPTRNGPEGLVHRPVPTDEGARSEEQRPEDGEAQADPAGRGVDAEHGEGGDQVQEQRARVD